MLLRLIAENIKSFKNATEFNMFTSSKSQNHDNHKIVCGHTSVLRMGAIYGANGAGKSNLIKLLHFLQTLVYMETLTKIAFIDGPSFKLDFQYTNEPSELAIEFYNRNSVFYYHIKFLGQEIISEELLLSQKNKDVELFKRNNTDITINPKLVGKGISEQFKDALKRLVRPDMLLLSFLGKYYPNESPIVSDAYQWFTNKLNLLLPEYKFSFVPHLLDTDPHFARLINNLLPELNTGINQIIVKKQLIDERDIKNNQWMQFTNEQLLQLIKIAKEHPNIPQSLIFQNDIINIVCENGNIYAKSLIVVHKSIDGSDTEFSIPNESDGTRRLIEYMPLLYDIIQSDRVYVVDEIERSLHPIMIKDIIRKISESENAKGQLIFTTHESCLLDQSIFRPDEIWFAQKDVEQATQLYPLSDFNIHKTANIENGYLDGRYGGIPFLSNLKDLNW